MTDREELAWAAGFFDGEGTAVLANANRARKRDRVSPVLAVTQHYDRECIDRFHRAVLGLGAVSGPYVSKGTAFHPRYQWACRRPIEVLAVVPLLWQWLSGPKRRQIASAVGVYLTDAQTRRPYYQTRGQRLTAQPGGK